MFLCLYKTSSRGPWIAAILGFILVFFYTLGPIKKYMFAIIVLCVLVMVVRPGVYDTISGFYDETVSPDNPMASSYQYRYSLRDVSVKAISKSATRELWGYGMESFYYLHLEGPFLGKEGHLFESCDSAWIEAMVETGFVGLGIFFLLLVSAAVRGVRSLPLLPKPDRYLQWVLVVNMLQYYFLMLSVAIYGWGQNGFMLWMTIAVSLAYPRVLRNAEASSAELAPAQPSLYSARSLVSDRS